MAENYAEYGISMGVVVEKYFFEVFAANNRQIKNPKSDRLLAAAISLLT